MIESNIEDLIKSHIHFNAGVSSQGWHSIFCAVCGDGTHTKGQRGGWRFDGDMAFYNCFNCNISGNFDPHRAQPYSKNMWQIFTDFGIPEVEHKAIAYHKLITDNELVKPKKKQIKLEIIPIPSYFYKLSEAEETNIVAQKAKSYILNRKIDPSSYPFYLSTGIGDKNDVRDMAIAKTLTNRIIIPAFSGEDMIYYQARTMDDNNSRVKYINPSTPKSNIIYGYNKLYKDLDKPLYISEGFFDSHHLDGVAVLGNQLSNQQIEILNKSPRRKIVVPDKKFDQKKNDDGKRLATQALELGWSIALPQLGNCTDVTKGIQQYGKLYVLNSISENISEGYIASIALTLW